MEIDLRIRLIAHLERIDNILSGKTLLYADLKQRNRELLERLLREEGVDGEDVSSGRTS
jgi:hypothetical protein